MKKENAEVLWVARYDYKPGWELKQHHHNYFQIIYAVRGTGIFILNEYEQDIHPGTLFFMKPGDSHGLVNNSCDTLKTLDIKFLIRGDEDEEYIKNFKSIYFLIDTIIPDLFEKIRQEGLNKKPFYQELSREYLIQMLYLLLRYGKEMLPAVPEEKSAPVVPETDNAGYCVYEYIKAHFSEDTSLDSISAALGYNKSYICQVFKRDYNTTPMKYLYEYRIEKAGELMIRSDYTLKQISEMTGFKSIHHFTRTFRSVKGMTPGQWCNKEREGIGKDIYLNDHFCNAAALFSDSDAAGATKDSVIGDGVTDT